MNGSKIYCIVYDREKKNTAGSKAPDDIAAICRSKGYTLYRMPAFPEGKSRLYKKLWLLTVAVHAWHSFYKALPEDSAIIYQHPSYGYRIISRYLPKIRAKGCRCIVLIHDLESLRGGIGGVIAAHAKTDRLADETLLNKFDAIICHNDRMKQYMVSRGFPEHKLVPLGIFDYLSAGGLAVPDTDDAASISIAGNLAMGKCRYIYEIKSNGQNSNLTINLYGNNYQEEYGSQGMIYRGSYDPDEISSHLKGRFGLVWDGDSADTCAGNTGEYLRYNNPHKTSLYLSSGMPVIVWNQSAIASFVTEHKVGIAVKSLNDLEEIILNVSEEEYNEMKKNVSTVSEKLRSGYYFTAALDKAFTIAEQPDM